MATHLSILAWRMQQTEEPSNLQSMSLRVVQDGSNLAHMQGIILWLEYGYDYMTANVCLKSQKYVVKG